MFSAIALFKINMFTQIVSLYNNLNKNAISGFTGMRQLMVL